MTKENTELRELKRLEIVPEKERERWRERERERGREIDSE